MSYILDALRKSDQLRQRGTAPTLLMGQPAPMAPRQPARITYAVLALIMLGVGIAIGWLQPWQPAPAVPPAKELATSPITANPAATQLNPAPISPTVAQPGPGPQELNMAQNIAATPTPAPATPAPAATPPAAATPAKAPTAATPPSASAPQKGADLRTEKPASPQSTLVVPATQATKPLTAPPTGAANATPTTTPVVTVMALTELPIAVQQELPPMSISVHAYSSKAAERLVGINNRLLHEGDLVAPGLRLEQITPEGMILSFKGYSFRRGVQ